MGNKRSSKGTSVERVTVNMPIDLAIPVGRISNENGDSKSKVVVDLALGASGIRDLLDAGADITITFNGKVFPLMDLPSGRVVNRILGK